MSNIRDQTILNSSEGYKANSQTLMNEGFKVNAVL